ncbi:DUF3854 domain-containing protein [Pleurocapsa sp. FMAR1]|uniref:DUF3854 domain-containing protein n=1 Tax=Pleurocapsa sp. FMAR1 TaxID=3040204 RepID=UPI0029C7E657|nr:DUF3854 domain-containing protein [Pleurocapsa sp. FMAR1]
MTRLTIRTFHIFTFIRSSRRDATPYFAFDRDTKASIIANVNTAIAKTDKLFTKTDVDVRVIRWHESAKGVDDLIVQKGAEAFHQAYSKALSLKTWLVRTSVQLTYKANI